VSLRIRLLGVPELERDGAPARPPRGAKSWALLAYLALSRRPPARRELAELLFGEAEDPLGALRWSLSELRRALEPEGRVGGDPVTLELSDAWLDVSSVMRGTPVEPADADASGRELLEGIAVGSAPGFDAWLTVERRRLIGSAEGALHESALARLAAEDHGGATTLAQRAVALNPLDEDHQELLVRCLAVGGNVDAAHAQVEAATDLFLRELGYKPSPAVQRAADRPHPFRPAGAGDPAAARSLLEAGQAAIAAGATEAGITSLREACTEAARCRDDALRAETLCALGVALVHVVRGWDGEGAASFHQALLLAERAGARHAATTAHRELGWIGVVAGRREQAMRHLALAEDLAEGDDEIAAVLGVRGINHSDTAAYPEAVATLTESLERARRAEDLRQTAYSAGMLARVHMLRGELADASELADQSIAAAEQEHWLAFQPFPETTRAEVDRMRGAGAEAERRFEHAFALGCRLGDPCWESFAARGLGMVAAERDDVAGARRWLEEGLTRCTRWPDIYQWAHAYVLEALVRLTADDDPEGALDLATTLEEVSSRAELRELTARALLHRARLGQVEAADGARLVARDIDNPVLAEDVDGVADAVASRA
jgi:DNA-binding SARP family transcriptional activator